MKPAFHGEYIGAGMFNLADIAAKLGYPVPGLLQMTAVRYGSYDPVLAGYISDVMTGKKPWTATVPKGVKLWCD